MSDPIKTMATPIDNCEDDGECVASKESRYAGTNHCVVLDDKDIPCCYYYDNEREG